MENYNWCLRWGKQKGHWKHKEVCKTCTEYSKNKCESYRESIGKPLKKGKRPIKKTRVRRKK